jgi:hypothetical protein
MSLSNFKDNTQYFKVNVSDIPLSSPCNVNLSLRFKSPVSENLILLYWFDYKQSLKFDSDRSVDVVRC